MQTVPTSERVPSEDRILTIPNVLSLARLATVPVFIWLFVSGRKDVAVGLYAIAAWTDFFDGYIARRTGAITELGRLLDPFADRVLIVALTLALVLEDVLPAWLAAVIVGRDVLILVGYPLVHRGAMAKMRVNFVGKTATAFLLLGLTLLALSETSLTWTGLVRPAGLGFVAVGAAFYWVSGVMYARDAMALRREGDGGEE